MDLRLKGPLMDRYEPAVWVALTMETNKRVDLTAPFLSLETRLKSQSSVIDKVLIRNYKVHKELQSKKYCLGLLASNILCLRLIWLVFQDIVLLCLHRVFKAF